MMGTKRDKSPKRREIESLYPDLTWFFGISPQELAKLPRAIKEIYVDALPRLIAGDQLRRIEAASFPHMEQGAQQRIQDRWRKYLPAEKETGDGVKVKTKEDLAAMGAMAGIGIVFESKKGGGDA